MGSIVELLKKKATVIYQIENQQFKSVYGYNINKPVILSIHMVSEQDKTLPVLTR
jgi:hypothetical protein